MEFSHPDPVALSAGVGVEQTALEDLNARLASLDFSAQAAARASTSRAYARCRNCSKPSN